MAKLDSSLLRHGEFRALLFTRMLAGMALQAQAVIVGWQVYSITKDPLYLGLIGLTEAIPALTAALFAGYLVDISRPYRIFVTCISVLVINTLIMMMVAGYHTHITDGSTIVTVIFVGVFISGLARSFLMPANFSLVPKIVKREQLSSASAWLSSSFQVAAIGGPAVAGILYGVAGEAAAWYLPSALMVTALLMTRFIKTVRQHRNNISENGVREPAFKSIRAGWSFILKNPVLLSVMSLDMFAVLFGGAVAVLPVFADQVLHVGSEGLGALRAAPALGAILMGLWLAFNPLREISAKKLLWTVVAFGVSIIIFGFSKNFWLSLTVLAISGAVDCVSMVYRGTLMQWLTPEKMRGRVSSVNSMFIISSNEIGAFRAGVMAKFMTVVPAVVLGGFMTVGVAAFIAAVSPKFRNTVVHADDKEPTA